jgi:hypothetical protein
MLPPDHPDAKVVLKHVDNNAERGSPSRTNSNESKRRRPGSIGTPLSVQESPPKKRIYDERLAGKENDRQTTASGKTRPGSIWNQFTSQASLLDQGMVKKLGGRPGHGSRPSSSSIPLQGPQSPGEPADPTQDAKSQPLTHGFNGTTQSRSTIGSLASAPSDGAARTGYGMSKVSLVGGREEALRSLQGEDFDQAFEAVLVGEDSYSIRDVC